METSVRRREKMSDIEIEVACPKCHVVCKLTEKREDGWYDDSCWNCGFKFPLIRAKNPEQAKDPKRDRCILIGTKYTTICSYYSRGQCLCPAIRDKFCITKTKGKLLN